jgi:hypothetical protein
VKKRKKTEVCKIKERTGNGNGEQGVLVIKWSESNPRSLGRNLASGLGGRK